MSNSISKTFGERLVEALEFQGITDPVRQVEKVAQACQITARTARKYLQATHFPFRSLRPLANLCKAFKVSSMWLCCGEGYGPYALQAARLVDSLPEWERQKYVRFFLRLRNDDPKAIRLAAPASGWIAAAAAPR